MRDYDTDSLVSINLLEFTVIIIDYAIAAYILKTSHSDLTSDPHPTLLNWADNMTAISWSKKAAASNTAGKSLSRIFAALRMDSALGLLSDFIAGKENIIANTISRFHSPNSTPNFQNLSQQLPQLSSCRRFHLNNNFVSILLQALLKKHVPGTSIPKTPGHWQADSNSI